MKVEQDLAVWNEWYPLGSPDDMLRRGSFQTGLLGKTLSVEVFDISDIKVYEQEEGRQLPVRNHLGLLWTTLGQPKHELFKVEEFDEPNRINVLTISTPQRTNSQRIVESVLDVARHPFLHPGILGSEEHTELKPFGEIEIRENGEFWSPDHFAWSPFTDQYEGNSYRVISPFSIMLHLHLPDDANGNKRWNIICLFAQPVDEENCIAHKWYSFEGTPNTSDEEKHLIETDIRSSAQEVAVQVKRTLVTQQPQKIPLYDGAESLVECDSAIIAYRKWMKDNGVQFGVLYEPETNNATKDDNSWYPIAAETDVPYGHLYAATLLNNDLMIWQDKSGEYHVWQDRCTHRGEKLSIGRHRGDKIQTAYQGWEYNTQGQCTFVPAHPNAALPDAPVKQYQHVIRDGLIWVCLSGSADEAVKTSLIADTPINDGLVLRPVTVNANSKDVAAQLPKDQALSLALRPVNDTKTVIYGVAKANASDRKAALHKYNTELSLVRDTIEASV